MRKASIALILAAASAAANLSIQFISRPLVVDAADVSLNNTGERVYQDEPFTGEVISYYESGELAEADQYAGGRRYGYSRKWFPNGVLGSEAYYENSRRNGTARTWWDSGNLRSESFYIDGKKEGDSWTWYRSGAEFKRAHFSQGHPTGLQQGWRENSDLFINFEYRNGRVYGLNKGNTCMGVEDEVLSPEYYKNQSS